MPDQALEATLAMLTRDASVRPERSLRGETLAAQVSGEMLLDEPPPDVSELPPIAVGENHAERGDLSVVRLLGEGGMGRVVLAVQRSMRRRIAVKTAHGGAHANAAIVREGVLTGMLEHPNIPPIHGLSRDADGRAVLLMKNIEGVSWAEVLVDPEHPLRKESPLFAGDARSAEVEILSQLCNALELAHAHGVIHRDIKPENVMLGRFGEVYLIDWGVAFNPEWHQHGEPVPPVGTPLYMAPELVLGEVPDARTDVYLIGATLHEILVGAPPHVAPNLRAVLEHAAESPAPSYGADVPADLADLCRRAMARRRDERPSVREVRAELRGHLSHRASIALCREAELRLEELRRLLADPSHDPVDLARLQHACEFGFDQALRDWPANADAAKGRADLCRALALHEVSLDNPRGARALLSQIPGGDPELQERIAACEARLHARAEAERRRAEEERQMDLRNAQRERTVVIVAIVLLASAIAAFRNLHPNTGLDLRRQHQSLLEIWMLLVLGIAGLLVAVRRRLSTHAVNRRWMALVLITMAAVTLNRITGVVLLPGIPATLAGDLIIAGAVLAMSAWAVSRALAWSVLPCAIGTIALFFVPGRAGLVFSLTGVACISLMAVMMRRQAGARPNPDGAERRG